jgi:anti-anti-sigma factor
LISMALCGAGRATDNPPVDLAVLEPADEPGSFRLVGEVDISNVDEVARHLKGTLRDNNRLSLDAASLTFIDSQGLRMLVELGRQAIEQFTAVRVLNCSPQLRHLMEIAVPQGIPGVDVVDPG